MAVTILETIKSKANAGNTAYIVILSLLCDTYSDLPTQYSLTGYELAQGCKAHVIDTNTDYMLDSSGNWHISGGEIWQNVYTKTETDTLLTGKQDTLSTAQLAAANSGVTAAKVQQYDDTVTDEAEDRASLVELVDGGGKNLLKVEAVGVSNIYGTTYEDNGVTYTLNSDGTVSLSGTASADSHTNLRLSNGSVITIDDFCNGNYVLSGCPPGGRGVFNLRARTADNAYILFDIGSGVTLTNRGAYSGIFISIFVQGGKDCTGLTFSPMICTKAAWDISHKFVPYCPSMQEMYQMILALQ